MVRVVVGVGATVLEGGRRSSASGSGTPGRSAAVPSPRGNRTSLGQGEQGSEA